MEDLDYYIKAGEIASKALKYGAGLIKKDAKIIDVVTAVEAKIVELGGEPAFPVNISFDNVAAHDTAKPNDDRVFDSELVKLDVGVHVNGCVGGDNAVSIDLSGKYSKLVEASRAALNNAVAKVGIGVKLCEIGKIIEDTIMSYGFEPIRNLSGHGVGKWSVHQYPTIPNYDNGDQTLIEEGMIFAIEPFATDGEGMINEKGIGLIHSITNKKPVRGKFAREVLKDITSTLPFSNLQLSQIHNPLKVSLALKEFTQLKKIRSYPPLVEVSGGIVSQAEHTVYVGKDGVKILTQSDVF